MIASDQHLATVQGAEIQIQLKKEKRKGSLSLKNILEKNPSSLLK